MSNVYSTNSNTTANQQSEPQEKQLYRKPLYVHISKMDLLVFTRELHTILASGMDISTGMRLISQQTQNRHMAKIVEEINKRIRSGNNLSSSMVKYPWLFDRVYIGSIRAGESNGSLEKSLANLEAQLTKEIAITKKVTQALVYPAISLLVCIVIGYLTFKYLLPNFIEFLTNLGGELPLITKIIINLVKFSDSPWSIFVGLAAIIICTSIFKQYASLPNGKQTLHMVLLALPGIGRIAKNVAYMHIAHSLATLLDAGIPLAQTIELAGETSGNTVFESSCQQASLAIRDGSSLAEFFQNNTQLYGKVFASMIAVGEESGNMPSMAQKLANMYEVEVDQALNALGVLIEPVLIFFTGGIIGTVMIAIFLPIYKTLSVMQ